MPLFLLAACQPQQPADAPQVAAGDLRGTWLQAPDENRHDTLAFRPNAYRFRQHRARNGFCIGPFGRFTQFDTVPGGGLAAHPGTWTAEGKDRLRIHLAEQYQPDYTLEIISFDKKLLRLRRQLPSPIALP